VTIDERAVVQADLENYGEALADLDQVARLAEDPVYAASGVLKLGPEFATNQQMLEAVRRLIMGHPKLLDSYEASPAQYRHLSEADLVFPTIITDTKGIVYP